MATVYRKTVTRTIPSNGERIERKGVLFVRFTAKGERKTARVVIGNDGQERMTVKAWNEFAATVALRRAARVGIVRGRKIIGRRIYLGANCSFKTNSGESKLRQQLFRISPIQLGLSAIYR